MEKKKTDFFIWNDGGYLPHHSISKYQGGVTMSELTESLERSLQEAKNLKLNEK